MLAQSAERQRVRKCRAQDGEFRAPARVPFFFCKKKGTKENHLDLRSKDPLARCGSCRFGGMHSRMKCGGGRCRFGGSLVPLAPLPLTAVRVGVGALIVFGDYQIAPKPPGGRLWLVAADAAGVWGTPPAGGTGDEGHLIRHGFAVPPVSLRVGRSAGLTRHRRVIQHRGPLKGKTNGGVSFNTANPSRGRLEGAPLTPRTPQGEG